MYIGVDIGGTQTRIGCFVAPNACEYVLLARYPTPQAYAEQVERITAEVHKATAGHVDGIGVSIGAQLAHDGRSVRVGANIPDYEGQPLARDLEDRCNCPVRLAHDPVCGLLAETRFGQLAGIDRAAYLTVSTGTGGAFRLKQGQNELFVSMQVSHQILDGNEIPCLCGQIGCLETYTGGKQLALRHGTAVERITDAAVWEAFYAKLAAGLVNLAHLTRVEVIAISGGIALHRPDFFPRARAALDARLRNTTLALLPAALGADAPLIGAVLLLTTSDDAIMH